MSLTVPGLILAGVGVLALLRRQRTREVCALIVPSVTYCVLFLLPIRFTYERFLLPVALLGSILAGIGTAAAVSRLRRGPTRAPAVSLLLPVGLVSYQFLVGFLPVTYVQLRDIKQQLARTLPSYVSPGSTLLYYGGVTDLPLAETYNGFRLALPSGTPLPDHSVRHVFVGRTDAAEFILSSRRIPSSEVSRVHEWVWPGVLKRYIHVPCITEYFLYRLTVPGTLPTGIRLPSG